ncbi:hypothetical protein LguiA_021795 [Lonicera macranthoides]
MEEDVVPEISGQDRKDDGGWTEVKETTEEEASINQDKEEIVPDETFHEVAVGKGLSGALRLLKDRGSLGRGIEWGGQNMDKKKSKLAGIYENDGPMAQTIYTLRGQMNMDLPSSDEVTGAPAAGHEWQ